MGNLESPCVQITAFYNHWLGFITVLDFFWADQYDAIMAGPNRKSRRVMEEENKKLRKKARNFSEEDKEYEAATTQGSKSEAEDYGNGVGYLSVNEDEVNELVEQFAGNVGIRENNNNNNRGDDGDDPTIILDAMLCGHKNKNRNKGPKSKVQADTDNDELEFMEYNDTKGSRRNRGAGGGGVEDNKKKIKKKMKRKKKKQQQQKL